MARPIQEFTRELLTQAGGLIEPAGDGALDVICGRDLAASLNLPEYQRLAFQPEAHTAGALVVDYDSPLVERMGHLVDALGRVACVALLSTRTSTKPPDAEAELARAVTLQNGVMRLRGQTAVEATYVGVVFEYSLLADEHTHGLIVVWVNPATRSVAALPFVLDDAELEDAVSSAAETRRSRCHGGSRRLRRARRLSLC